MKKLIVLFLLGGLTLTSCSSDDNNGPTEQSKIEFNALNINDKAPGATVIATGKNLEPEKIDQYQILFSKAIETGEKTTRSIPLPDPSYETVKATIYHVDKTFVEFSIPQSAASGDVIFVDGKFNIRMTTYQPNK
ncbi:hypothetical protein [Myroides pelagicus]|uniref:Uncharacterized protein n=1 Tax=Myroides pelagicus TaxID=270914 RepID=A0A7K1GNQ6_9FLAO|nr:hypothetical protein [Myroides pelagicus]MTH30023.1 hypothetical protein [Myroides pelagicus]